MPLFKNIFFVVFLVLFLMFPIDNLYSGGIEPPEPPDEVDGPFCSQTMGGWGAKPRGNNPGSVLSENFEELFPDGLVIGNEDYSTLLFTSSMAVERFLPCGGKPSTLEESLTDPKCKDVKTVCAGQLLAATINVAMSEAGIRTDGAEIDDPEEDEPDSLSNLLLNDSCFPSELAGLSVSEFLDLSNQVIGGDILLLPQGLTLSELCDGLASLNENFVDCSIDLGCFDIQN